MTNTGLYSSIPSIISASDEAKALPGYVYFSAPAGGAAFSPADNYTDDCPAVHNVSAGAVAGDPVDPTTAAPAGAAAFSPADNYTDDCPAVHIVSAPAVGGDSVDPTTAAPAGAAAFSPADNYTDNCPAVHNVSPSAVTGDPVDPTTAAPAGAAVFCPSDNYTDDCPAVHNVSAPALARDGHHVDGPKISTTTAAPSGYTLSRSAITPAPEDNTLHGRTPPRVLTWKKHLWFWVSVLGHALLPILVIIFYLSQSHHSGMIYVGMVFMAVAVLLVTFFLNFALTHAFKYLMDQFPNEIVNSTISLIVEAIYCTITILISKLSRPDLVLYVHLISVIYSSTFMMLLTYIFSEDVGNARAIFTMQAFIYMMYYLQQQNMKLDILLYAVTTIVGIATLIIKSDGPIESINEAFLRIISLNPRGRIRVQSNNEA